jgi:Holliday junction resolvase-like predicted endonuclease
MRKNHLLVARNWRSPFAQVDLLVRSPQGVLKVVEVKSCRNPEYWPTSCQPKQLHRLRKVVQWLCGQGKPTELLLAFVSESDEITLIEQV